MVPKWLFVPYDSFSFLLSHVSRTRVNFSPVGFLTVTIDQNLVQLIFVTSYDIVGL